MYSLAQAAKASGKSKPTLVRWIKTGRLSARRNNDGSYTIDPAELARVSPIPGDIGGMMKQLVAPNGADTEPAISAGEVEGLRLLLKEREETIRDLRARLDAEAEERRQEAEERRRLLNLLTDQRAPRPPWWKRWFR
jgi:Helix-turn-helix domain